MSSSNPPFPQLTLAGVLRALGWVLFGWGIRVFENWRLLAGIRARMERLELREAAVTERAPIACNMPAKRLLHSIPEAGLRQRPHCLVRVMSYCEPVRDGLPHLATAEPDVAASLTTGWIAQATEALPTVCIMLVRPRPAAAVGKIDSEECENSIARVRTVLFFTQAPVQRRVISVTNPLKLKNGVEARHKTMPILLRYQNKNAKAPCLLPLVRRGARGDCGVAPPAWLPKAPPQARTPAALH